MWVKLLPHVETNESSHYTNEDPVLRFGMERVLGVFLLVTVFWGRMKETESEFYFVSNEDPVPRFGIGLLVRKLFHTIRLK